MSSIEPVRHPITAPPHQQGALSGRRLIVIAGKGGVGRTTVAALLALALHKKGKSVLLAQVQAQGDITRALGGTGSPSREPGPGPGDDPEGKIVEVRPGLSAVNMAPAAALKEYGEMVFRSAKVAEAIFDSRPVAAFLRAIPGLDDYSMLGKVWYHAKSAGQGRADKDSFDVVILDGPASGHLLAMLRVPKALAEGLPDGPLVRDAADMVAMLRDARQTTTVLVTLAEELPVAEALELRAGLAGELGMAVGCTIVNRLYPDPPGALAPDLLGRLVAGADEVLAAAARTASKLARLAGRQAAFVADLGSEPVLGTLPIVKLPLVPKTQLAQSDLVQLAQYVEDLV